MGRRTALLAASAVALATITVGPPAQAARPNTKIKSGPVGLVATRTATFAFKSTKPGSTLQCRLDGSKWSGCTSPKTYSNLGQGSHSFKVRARKDGKTDKTPASRSFEVDAVAPDTFITSGPPDPSPLPIPTFEFMATEPATFACTLAGLTIDPCVSPYTPAVPLAEATYTFTVRAEDAAGNVDSTPAVDVFSVDVLP